MNDVPTHTSLPHRVGDQIKIEGGYQHRARTDGFVVQRFWHAEKERVIRRHNMPAPGEAVLDIGCGSGVLSDFLARHGANVTAIDSNPAAIEYARRVFGDSGADFKLATVDELQAPPGTIDRTYSFELIEHIHLHQVQELSRRVFLLTRPGGTWAVTTPNYQGVWPAIERTLDFLKLVPHLDRDQHVTHFTAARLRQLLSETGWIVERISTFSTLAPWVSMFGWRLAERLADREDRWNLPFGSILFAIARKPSTLTAHA
jgi:2-polyprenyl-3-methyl-5-hydroxy-6-metoxy-1,4-benzoquinol methylase